MGAKVRRKEREKLEDDEPKSFGRFDLLYETGSFHLINNLLL